MKAMIIYTEHWDAWAECYIRNYDRVLLFDDMDIVEMSCDEVHDSFGLSQDELYVIVPFSTL